MKSIATLTNQEKNEAVARKLKGWFSKCTCKYPVETAHHNCPAEFGNCHHAENCNLPDYCTSIEAAWGIVEKMEWFCLQKEHDGSGWSIWDTAGTEEAALICRADTAPMAIVDAFLKMNEAKA